MPLRRRAVALVIATTVLLVSCAVDRTGDQPDSAAQPIEQTVLLVGIDDHKRADSIMLAHVGTDKTGAAVSLPRDLLVAGPDGKGKLNAVYTTGGINPLIEAVEALTGVRAEHYAIVEMALRRAERRGRRRAGVPARGDVGSQVGCVVPGW